MVPNTMIYISLLWLPQALYQLLNIIYWLQVKEYRADRFVSFIKSQDGKAKTNFYFIVLKIIISFFLIFQPALFVLLAFAYFIFGLIVFFKLFQRKLRRPVFTQRAKKITASGLVAILISVILVFVLQPYYLAFLIMEALLLLSPFVGILWTRPIVEKVKSKEIAQAASILKEINPVVIGITGSYGKSTTKEFVFQLLSKKYNCEKTTKNENTDFGIARKIIRDFSNDTQIFIAEMGAYKKGEIAKLAEFVNPSIGVITGIEPQHLDLFGSLENIKEAKYELIASLPGDGVAVFNLSDANTISLIEKAKKRQLKNIVTYKLLSSIDQSAKSGISITSRILNIEAERIKFLVSDSKNEMTIIAPLAGVHFVENLTGAILVARLLKVPWRTIIETCKTINTPEGTMKIKKLKNGSIFVDDSYNATPKSFEAALDYLSLIKAKRKVLVTPGIIELGDKSASIHKKLGKLADSFTDRIIVSNIDVKEKLSAGVNNKQKIELINNPDKLIDELETEIVKGSLILVEGRVAEIVIKYLNKSNK